MVNVRRFRFRAAGVCVLRCTDRCDEPGDKVLEDGGLVAETDGELHALVERARLGAEARGLCVTLEELDEAVTLRCGAGGKVVGAARIVAVDARADVKCSIGLWSLVVVNARGLEFGDSSHGVVLPRADEFDFGEGDAVELVLFASECEGNNVLRDDNAAFLP